MMVVAVLMMSCQFSEKPTNGPEAAQTSRRAQASANTVGRPDCRATAVANFENISFIADAPKLAHACHLLTKSHGHARVAAAVVDGMIAAAPASGRATFRAQAPPNFDEGPVMLLYVVVVIAAGCAAIVASADFYLWARWELERWKARRRRLA